jgi:hypothetical protein
MSILKILLAFSYFFGLLVAIQLQETGAEDAFGTYVRSKIDLDLLELLKTLLHDRINELNDPEKVLLDPVSVKLAKEIMKIRKMEITECGKLSEKQRRFLGEEGQYLLNSGSKPETFNEHVHNAFVKFYNLNEATSWFCNKLTAKLFVRDIVGAKYVARLYGAFKNLDEILQPAFWNKLPQKFVVKGGHGAYGQNVRVIDKNETKTVRALRSLKCAVTPRVCEERFIVEEFLPSLQEGRTITDYKFVCSFGKIICVIVGNAPDEPGPFTSHDKWQAIYTVPGWYRLPAQYGWRNPLGAVEKPEKLDEMMEVARKLSLRFPLIRIDLYLTKDHDGQLVVKVGELTRRSSRARIVIKPVCYDLLIGASIPLLKEGDLMDLIVESFYKTCEWLSNLRQSSNVMHEIVMPGFEVAPHICFDSRTRASREMFPPLQPISETCTIDPVLMKK